MCIFGNKHEERKMKRFSTILLTALLIFALIPTAVLGEDEAMITLSSVDGAKPGDEITIDVTIAGSYQAHVVNFTFEYDPEALEIISAKQGSLLENAASSGILVILDEKTLAPVGRVVLGIVGAVNPLEGEGELLEMKFRIKDGVTVNQQVKLYVSEFSNMPISETTSTPIKYTLVNSIITLINGTVPEGGYDKGETGYEQGVLTAVPGFTPPPYDPSASPFDVPSIDPQIGSPLPTQSTPAPNGSEKPEATKGPGSEGSSAAGIQNNDDEKPAKSSSVLIYVLIGVLAAAAAAAIAVITIRKKKDKK